MTEEHAVAQSLHDRDRIEQGSAAPGLDRELLLAHYSWVHSVARNLVRDRWGAEDVTQETVLAALAAPPRDAADAQHLRAWLGRVAFNLSRLGARQGARRRAREERVARREALPSVSEELEAAAALHGLSAAISALAEPYRSAILMRYFDGLSTAEIARRSGTTELAVRKRLWRARGKLREELEQPLESGRSCSVHRNGKRNGPFFAGFLAWLRSPSRPAVQLAGISAALLAAVAVPLWVSNRASEERTLAEGSPRVAAARAEAGSAPRIASVEEPATTSVDPGSARRPVQPPSHSHPQHPPVREETRGDAPAFSGTVLDLEGRPRAGVALCTPELPAEELATTDALGSFTFRPAHLPLRVEARAEGWTTVCAAELERGQEAWPATLVVAPACDVEAQVVSADVGPLAGAQFELCCDETAFAHLPRVVHLPSAVLRTARADSTGACSLAGLPRAPGFRLRIEHPGYAGIERETTTLAAREVFVLSARRAGPEIAGIVLHQDGTPAANATVSLALASTRTDLDGRFHLARCGVQPDSALEAHERGFAPARLADFGTRLGHDVPREFHLVLGDPRDTVLGRVDDDDGASSWDLAVMRHSALDGEDAEALRARTRADGTFELELERGSYQLLALDSHGLRWVAPPELDSSRREWRVDASAAPAVQRNRGQLVTSDGEIVGGALVKVRARHGALLLDWKELRADASGRFEFLAAAEVDFELEIEHPALGTGRFEGHTGNGGERTFVLPRACWLQVADAAQESVSFSVLDADGRALVARGPLHAGQAFALCAGASAVLEVPREARWLQLERADGRAPLVPVLPQAGALLIMRP